MAQPKFEIGDRVKYLVKANRIHKGRMADLYDVVEILGFYKQDNQIYYRTDGGVKAFSTIDLTGEKVPKNANINTVVYKRTNRRNRTRKNRTRKNRTRKLR